eukprot:TRINITY_DN1634_c0_g1_i1.p2 TRINITY_DN1634_c0_g1~~TRINITY_DN1634_c0_g1_i1.p2  ORF type:complete len:104 (+),score=18.91 TRINITY_DN1634_c0_g1_i1:268-579(+)
MDTEGETVARGVQELVMEGSVVTYHEPVVVADTDEYSVLDAVIEGTGDSVSHDVQVDVIGIDADCDALVVSLSVREVVDVVDADIVARRVWDAVMVGDLDAVR